MKQPRNFTVNERKHVSKSIARVEDWTLSKKETDIWLIVHKITGQAKRVLSP